MPVSEPALALVLKNLLKNAITHGSEQGRVAVRISQSARNWTLVVADDGPGLSEEQWARRAIDPRRAHEGVKLGSGLGLTMAQAAEILNGQLTWGAGLDGRAFGIVGNHPVRVSIMRGASVVCCWLAHADEKEACAC